MPFNCPYIEVSVTRNPMHTQIRQVLAHEYFLLEQMHQDVHVTRPVKDARGRQMTRTVEANEEYERLQRAYGDVPGTETSRVAQVFGPPFSATFQDALAGGLRLFNFDDAGGKPTPTPADDPTPTPADDPTPTPADDPTPTPADDPTPSPVIESLVRATRAMLEEDPQKTKEEWWTKDGAPEINALKKRVSVKFSKAQRDEAYAAVTGAGAQEIDGPAVMAMLDDMNIAYEPEAPPEALLELLHGSLVDRIQALGGTPPEGATTEQLAQQFAELEAEA